MLTDASAGGGSGCRTSATPGSAGGSAASAADGVTVDGPAAAVLAGSSTGGAAFMASSAARVLGSARLLGSAVRRLALLPPAPDRARPLPDLARVPLGCLRRRGGGSGRGSSVTGSSPPLPTRPWANLTACFAAPKPNSIGTRAMVTGRVRSRIPSRYPWFGAGKPAPRRVTQGPVHRAGIFAQTSRAPVGGPIRTVSADLPDHPCLRRVARGSAPGRLSPGGWRRGAREV